MARLPLRSAYSSDRHACVGNMTQVRCQTIWQSEHVIVQALQELPLQKNSSTMLTDIRALHLQCKRSKVSMSLHTVVKLCAACPIPAASRATASCLLSSSPGACCLSQSACIYQTPTVWHAGLCAGRACHHTHTACHQQPCLPCLAVEIKPLVGTLLPCRL